MTVRTGLIAGGILLLIILILAIVIVRVRDQEEENQSEDLQRGVREEATDLEIPWDIAFLPDGRMIFTERTGNAFLLSNREKTDLGYIEGTVVRGEGGLLGVAVDPDFAINNYLYFYYTYLRGGELRNGVVRYTLEGNQLIGEIHLIDTIPAADNHNGGGLRFGPDGKLYIATGDASQPGLAQDTNSLAGKILRINKDGSMPDDNPFGNAVWAFGLRNPQGMTWNINQGIFYATEHGSSAMDEINVIEKGKNYGWPAFECGLRRSSQQVENAVPMVCFDSFTLAPSGIGILGSSLYVGGLRGQQLRRLELNDDLRSVQNQEVVFDNYGRIRAVTENNGLIYFSTSNRDGRGTIRSRDDRIIRYLPF
ncbi:MAG: PQQ-dependent sugar dehydrogenase [Patescibacteria group bacterium]